MPLANQEDKIYNFNFKPTLLGERISETLAQAIMEGVFKGGDQLVEPKLQKQFGVSRSPLREAFRDLEKKGLVVIVPRRGTFVKTVTRQDIEDHFPVRAVLEGLAAREAYRRMNEEDIEDMAGALRNMETAAAASDAKAFREHHIAFHEIFIYACGNEVLIKILENLRMHSVWHRFCYQYYKEDFQKSIDIHRKILAFFQDPHSGEQKIEKTVREHIEVALERFLAFLEMQGK